MNRVNPAATAVMLILLIGVLGMAGPAANLALRPGEYTVTVTSEVQGQRQSELRTAVRCVREQDLTDPERIFNDQTGPLSTREVTCSVKGLKSASGTISYEADCANRTVHVQGSLSNMTFSVVRTVIPKASEGVSLKFTVRGNWMGACRLGTR